MFNTQLFFVLSELYAYSVMLWVKVAIADKLSDDIKSEIRRTGISFIYLTRFHLFADRWTKAAAQGLSSLHCEITDIKYMLDLLRPLPVDYWVPGYRKLN